MLLSAMTRHRVNLAGITTGARLLVIIGYIIVCGSVFGGFAASGGHLASLFQPLALVMTLPVLINQGWL